MFAVSLAYAYAGSLAVDLKEVVSGHTRLSPLTLLLLGGVSAAFFGAAVALLTMYTRRQLRRWAPTLVHHARVTVLKLMVISTVTAVPQYVV